MVTIFKKELRTVDVVARTIKVLGITDANYTAAWENLKTSYEDANSVIHHNGMDLLNCQ